MPNKFVGRIVFTLIGIAVISSLFLPSLSAEYSIYDKQNRIRFETEIKSLREQVRIAKAELDGETKHEWKANLEVEKGSGKTRQDKINVGRDSYDATETLRATSEQYKKLETRYFDLRERLKQVEWELKQLDERAKKLNKLF